MNKVIEFVEKDGSIIIKCNEKTVTITNNTLDAKSIFDLLQYEDGDEYSVKPVPETSNDTLKSIFKLFEDLAKQIKDITPAEKQVANDFQSLEN